MIILHLAFSDGELLLWGESAKVRDRSPQHAPRAHGVANPARYPFATPNDALTGALATALGSLVLPTQRSRKLSVWLPTVNRKPLPSSPLIAEPLSAAAEPTLAPWAIHAYPLTAGEALDFLGISLDRQPLAPGLIVGTDLAYWAQALRLAGALVARQHFLPGLVAAGDDYTARWQPVIGGGDATLISDFAGRMPPVARALTKPGATAPSQPAYRALEDFLALAVDELVRSTTAKPAQLPLAKPPRATRESKAAFDSVHDAWLAALRSTDPRVYAGRADLKRLAEALRDWRRPLTTLAAAEFRLCFRLDEPPAESAAWTVRYLLQPHRDPSLLIPAPEVLKPRPSSPVVKQLGPALKEYTLSALGQAAGLNPHIAASLTTAAPDGFGLDTTSAYGFLSETAPILEQAGFGVMLPTWWSGRSKLKVTVQGNAKSPKLQGGNRMTLDSLVRFDWQIAVGDEPITLRELEALAKLKTPLVKLRGQWVELNADDIQAAIAFWKNQSKQTMTASDAVRMAFGAGSAEAPVAIGKISADGWLNDLLDRLSSHSGFTEWPVPQGFSGTLRPYQQRGFSWLAFLRQWGLGACLADDMGLGKTIQTLALIQREREVAKPSPVLLICPTSVVNNWLREAARFTPTLKVLVHHGPDRAKGKAFAKAAKRHDLVITSYGLLQRDSERLKDVPWSGLILDEAQNIKNPETQQAKAARSLAADYRIALTGTPVENNVGDLWSLMEFLNPGWLDTQAAFKRHFFVPIQVEQSKDAAERLKRVTGPFILRRLKTDRAVIADLPDKLEMNVYCTLTREQASLYAAVLEDADQGLEEAEGIQRRGVILGVLSKLKQVCNHPAQFLKDHSAIADRSGKLARLTEMLEEVLEAGERALVFSQFAEMGALLQTHLQETFGREALFLHGGVTKRRRDAMVERFQGADGPRFFILSLKAGGTGLNLTQANHVFHFDRWWNPAVENQATDRAFRIGQQRNVQVHKFICAGTLEESIDALIESKKAIAEQVVGSGESWLTELSNQDLKRLLALRPEAIGD